MNATCRHDGLATVRLWDGRDHCIECVEAACPGLVDLARTREDLVDSIPYDQSAALAKWARFFGVLFAVLALTAAGFFAAMDRASAALLVGSMAACCAVVALVALLSVFRARHVLPTVRVAGGTVDVFRPDQAEGRRPVVSYPLAEARWQLGRVRKDEAFYGRFNMLSIVVPDRPAVILRAPRGGVLGYPSVLTATGSTPEMVRLWQGFLRLAGVPEGK